MKYYLVARTACAMVGIEQCRGYIVSRSLQAAFERQFAGRILMVTAGAQVLPGISFTAYERAFGPFLLRPSSRVRSPSLGWSHQSHKSNKSRFRQFRQPAFFIHTKSRWRKINNKFRQQFYKAYLFLLLFGQLESGNKCNARKVQYAALLPQ